MWIPWTFKHCITGMQNIIESHIQIQNSTFIVGSSSFICLHPSINATPAKILHLEAPVFVKYSCERGQFTLTFVLPPKTLDLSVTRSLHKSALWRWRRLVCHLFAQHQLLFSCHTPQARISLIPTSCWGLGFLIPVSFWEYLYLLPLLYTEEQTSLLVKVKKHIGWSVYFVSLFIKINRTRRQFRRMFQNTAAPQTR